MESQHGMIKYEVNKEHWLWLMVSQKRNLGVTNRCYTPVAL